MYQNERTLEIQKILAQESYVTVRQLSQLLYTSESSIRRDLTALEKQGLVKRSYGGVELVKNSTQVSSFSARVHHNIAAKKIMAEKAVKLIRDGDIIFLDQSSSAFFVAGELPAQADITVVTNNIEIVSLLSRTEIEVISCGGRLSPSNRICLLGDDAQQVFREIRANLAFFSSKALSPEGVIYDCNREEVCIRSTMLDHAERKVFLCASEKYGRYSGYRQCSLEDADYMITETDDQSLFPTLTPYHGKII